MWSNLFKRPPLEDNHSSKATNSESAQANPHTIISLLDNSLSTATSDHFFLSPKQKEACLKQPLQNFTKWRNGKQT